MGWLCLDGRINSCSDLAKHFPGNSCGRAFAVLQAFVVDKLRCYALICTADKYLLILYEPGHSLWCSPAMDLPLSETTTPEQLASSLQRLISMLACAMTRQMTWVDTALTTHPELENSMCCRRALHVQRSRFE